jgi:dihydroorotate dehydrogenase electron transfer subunit
MNKQRIATITSVARETADITTLRFYDETEVRPGQFYMVWIPGIDEIPMSASYTIAEKGITVKNVGEATKALGDLKVHDRIGIRGPYGNGYEIPAGKVLIAGGGTGMASLLPAAEMIADRDRVDVLIGAKTESEILLLERARMASKEVQVSTDDGSMGEKGTVVDLVQEHLGKKRYDMVLGCGPERMLSALLKVCDDASVECQLSLERFMKCGAGLCGSCVIDGIRVCREGPVFSSIELRKMKEFGSSKRDECGRSIKL